MVENKLGGVGIEEDPPLVYVAAPGQEQISPPCAPSRPQDEWTCPQCTLLNPARKLYCIACFHRHPDLPPRFGPTSSQQDYNEGDEYEHHGNYVESSAPFEDTNERYTEDRNVVRGAMEDDEDEGGDFEPVSSWTHHHRDEVLPAGAEEDPFHKKVRRRMRRKRRMAAGGAAGVVAGAILGGPALVAAGLVGGAVGTRIVSKHRERLKDERVAMQRYETETKSRGATATTSVSS